MQEALKVLDLLAAGKIGNQDPRVEEALREAVAFCRQQTDEGNLRAQLSAAQAQWENEHRLWNEADTKLSAAQAEIENQQSQVAELQRLGVELETNLANLRTAAKKHLENNPTGNGVFKFRAEIEGEQHMRHNDQETAELTRDVIELSRELATLKRQHEQLRAVARPFVKRYGENDDVWALRAALDATPAEPQTDSVSKQALVIAARELVLDIDRACFPECGDLDKLDALESALSALGEFP